MKQMSARTTKVYLERLRAMSPEQKLFRAFEMSEFTREVFRQGLRKIHPELSESQLHALFLERIGKCYNRKS